MNNAVIIIGAGQAGFQCAASLRDNGFDGRVILVGNEGRLPYQRPPLSKSFLLGDATEQSLQFRPARYFVDRNIELHLNDAAIGLDTRGRSLLLRSGRRLNYDHLVLATGARNRKIAFSGEAEGLHYLRTASEAEKLRRRLSEVTNVVVIGAGFVGLEVATALAKLDKRVVVLDVMQRVMSRVVTPVTADFFTKAHRSSGIKIYNETQVTDVATTNGRVSGVRTSQGRIFPTDMVLVGVGVVPNTELAAEAGLAVNDGIVVDRELRTSDPHISAIGDCARFPNSLDTGMMRIESVQNAVDQARLVALRLTQGSAVYKSVPWFWSDQAGAKLQIVGVNTGWDRTVTRGNLSCGKFSVFCFKQDELVAIESINSPMDHMLGRKIVGEARGLRFADALMPGFDIKSWAEAP